MADQCAFCGERRPNGGTNHLVLNGGELWIEFCLPCGQREVLTNGDTGETLTVVQLFNRCADKRDGETLPEGDGAPKEGEAVEPAPFGTSLADVLGS